MRKAQKEQVQDFVGLLEEAHEQIRLDLEKKQVEIVLQLLADCQNGAVALGDLIEKCEGEDHPTISYLEEYCELVYEIHQKLSEGQEELTPNQVYKPLTQMLRKFAQEANAQIPIRKEVVFLPYKASMWDSLESVWRAADADPNCDAYVIPIPYYDRKPDGSFGQKHYEGGDYPKDVPVFSYEQYDFEKRKPDIIYIHNPYDEFYRVTSVEPFFYTKNLKKFTDQLIYIPYFVLQEVDPNDEMAVTGMEHFVVVPGVIYSDQVIVQSEAMRQVYVNVMTKETGEENRAYWEQKILGLGSPKFDKVAETVVEEGALPLFWRQRLYKLDGTRKKVILYNTSVSALLQHTDGYLEKMRHVFSIFEKNQEDILLLWRPHPLIPATISSMRPQLWEEYCRLVEDYKEDGWGIYDDSPELDRAIRLSDGYYGDASSVVQLCQKVGMPILIQNVEIRD
jgi:hypothetical protein